MARYNVHGGHNSIVPGAASLLNEVTEDRKVKNELISLLKSAGNTVYDCTDDKGTTSSKNLANIVAKCNAHSVDLDMSIHLNSGRKDKSGDGKTGGVEVFICNIAVKDTAKKIADAIAEEFGYALRSDSTTPSGCAGVKITKGLYVLNHTKAKACLVECCFVDDKDDAKVWNAKRCARAIAKALTGKNLSSSSSTSTKTEAVNSGGTSGKYWENVKMENFDRFNRSQKWILHHHSDGTYSIENQNSKLYLSVKDGQMKQNQPIWNYSWNGTKSQRFKISTEVTSDLTAVSTIASANNDEFVLQTSGENLCIGKKTGRYAQRFVFIPTGVAYEYYILTYGSGQAIAGLK